MQITQLDHLVLTVRDIEQTCVFYTEVLGMELQETSKKRKSLHFGSGKINLHQYSAEYSPHAATPAPGSADLCLLTTLPIDRVTQHLQHHKIQVIDGPVQRTGATGPLLSIYIRDPDGNLIEIANSLSSLQTTHTESNAA